MQLKSTSFARWYLLSMCILPWFAATAVEQPFGQKLLMRRENKDARIQATSGPHARARARGGYHIDVDDESSTFLEETREHQSAMSAEDSKRPKQKGEVSSLVENLRTRVNQIDTRVNSIVNNEIQQMRSQKEALYKTIYKSLEKLRGSPGSGSSPEPGIEGPELAIDPPSFRPQTLTNMNKDSWSQWGQDKILEPILMNMPQPGFFVESGSLDGETDSNTLYYEMKKGWTGLLVEPSPRMYPRLRTKNRHAWSYNGCLSTTGKHETLRFDPANPGEEGIARIDPEGSAIVEAQPLGVLMEKLGRSTIDFWSLDIEGAEAAVLRSVDFNNIEVGLVMIEMNKNKENNNGILAVLNREGFIRIGHTLYNEGGGDATLDNIFINPKYFQKRGLAVPSPLNLPARNQD